MEERITISKNAFVSLHRLAEKRGISLQRVLEDCVSTEVYMDRQLAQDKIVLIQDPNDIYICADCGYNSGAVYKVVFTHMNRKKGK